MEQNNSVTRNPCKKFLELKNLYEQTEVKNSKGMISKVKSYLEPVLSYSEKEGEVWVNKSHTIPIEFAVINAEFISFKGWNDKEKAMYWSNEVNNNDLPIYIKNKNNILFEFTINAKNEKVKGGNEYTKNAKDIRATLKELNVKQHSCIYIAIKGANDEFELAGLQLKGSSLSGIKDPGTAISGWWAFCKKFKNNNLLYKHFVQINDYIVENGELGEYGVLNYTLGDVISDEDNEKLEIIFDELKEYHDYYLAPTLSKEPPTDLIKEELSDTDINNNDIPF